MNKVYILFVNDYIFATPDNEWTYGVYSTKEKAFQAGINYMVEFYWERLGMLIPSIDTDLFRIEEWTIK